ncbi:choice-of-anchor A family protein [Cellulosimicrobium terreum]|nr:choice-of-anchor A family protein [Cellulosimicrobium terreum]
MHPRSITRTRALDRSRRVVAALVASMLALVGAVVLVTGPQARPASAAIGFCPDPDDIPDVGPLPPLFTDQNVAVYSGGDYHATASAAESEGLLVVAGDALIDAPGNFSVGSVGAGSQITPPDGDVMLAVAGGLEIAAGTSVTVGSTLPSGGAVDVGDTVTGGGTLSTAGTTPGADAPVTESMGAEAIADWADFGTVISDTSATIGGWSTTAPAVVAGSQVTFTGSGTDDPQVFSVDAAALAGVTEIVFADIPDGTAIAINVTGDAPVDVSPNYWEGNGEPFINGLATPGFGSWASRILWNFEDTTDLALGRADQFLGTILAPQADATFMTSTNGRVLIGGNLTFGDESVPGGLEMHNYPWIGPGPFDCIPSSSFGVQKTVTGEASADVPADTTFDVDYTYEEPDGTTGGDTLTVPISGELVYGPDLPVGTVVTISETDLPDVPGVEWGTPVIQVDGEPLGDPVQFTIAEDQTVTVTVVNTANGGGEVVVGGFTVAKAVTGDAAGLVPDDTEFAVDWTATVPDGVEFDGETSGTLTVLADGTVVDGPDDLPVGTTVTLTEQQPLPEVDGVVWGEPSFSPASPITVVEGASGVAVTLTNTADAVVGGFTVAKSVTGDAAGLVPDDTEFAVDWTASVPDGVDYDGETSGTLTVLADGTVVDGPDDLPVGTTVTLTERQPLPEVDGVVWGTPTIDPASPITIVEGATGVEVTLTNTADAEEEIGGFSLSKAMTGGASRAVPVDAAFDVEWAAELPDGAEYDGPTSGTLTVLADGTVVDGPQDLPEATVVTFVEVEPLPEVDGVDWGTPEFSPTSVTIGTGDTSAGVVLTNTADAQVGGFALAKSVTGGTADLVPGGTEFQVEWTAEVPDVFTYDGATTGTLTVLADGTVVDGPQDLPVGTVVTFTEVNLPDVDGVVWGAPTFSPGSVTIGEDESTLVTLTNTTQDALATGGFSAAKEVTGDRADLVAPDTVFTVAYSYELEGVLVGGSLEVPADGTVVDGPQNLPVGTVVSYTEADLPPVDGVAWGTPSFSPATVTVGEDENTLVTVTNTADQGVGGFAVAKDVVGDAADDVPGDTELTATWSAAVPDGATYAGATSGRLTLLADGTVVEGPQDLPVGTAVTIAEVDLPEVDGVEWGTPVLTVDGEEVAVVTIAAGGPVLVTLTNTASDDGGPLATTGTDAALAAGTGVLLILTGAGLVLIRAHRRRTA